MALTDEMNVSYFCIFLLLYMYRMDYYIGHIYTYVYSNLPFTIFAYVQILLFVAVIF